MAAGLCGLFVLPAAAAPEDGKRPDWQAAAEAKEQGGDSARPSSEREGARRRYLLLGLLNLHPKLAESTAQIDRDINERFGLLLPGWREPETFADWRDRGMIVNGLIGYGEDINNLTGWFVVAAWGAGPIKNTESYRPLGIPIEVDVNFYRSTLVLEAGLDLFPWGRPAQKPYANFRERLRSTRPFFTFLGGMNWQREEAGVSVRLPVLGRLVHIEDKEKHTHFYGSLTAGLEFPLGKRTSVIAAAGYNLFAEDPGEYNGPLIVTTLRWRF